MYVGITEKICALLEEKPGLTANDIYVAIGSKQTSVKVILTRLVKKNLLVREKAPRAQKTDRGPQNLYIYKVAQVNSDNANTQN